MPKTVKVFLSTVLEVIITKKGLSVDQVIDDMDYDLKSNTEGAELGDWIFGWSPVNNDQILQDILAHKEILPTLMGVNPDLDKIIEKKLGKGK